MTTAFDYLVGAAAYIFAFEEEGEVKFPETEIAFSNAFENYYGVPLAPDLSRSVLQELHRLSFINVLDEKYAGLIITFDQDDFDRAFGDLADAGTGKFVRPADQAMDIYRRTIKNENFWQDIDRETKGGFESSAVEIPASDRIVTLSHNSDEGKLIIRSADRIIDELQTNNAVASEAGLDRDRLVAEGRATKELIKGDRITFVKLKTLILSFFKEVYSKFKEKAAEWSVTEVLSILTKMLDLIK